MTAAPASVTLQTAARGVAAVSSGRVGVLGLVAVGLGLISPGAVAG